MKAFKLSLSGLLLFLSLTSYAQNKDEQVIRELIKQENAGKTRIPFTQNYIAATGLYPRPVIGVARIGDKTEGDSPGKVPRRVMNVLRLTVSEAGDIANEFGTYSASAEAGGKHAGKGSYLRTWKKVNGAWKVDILFTAATAEPTK